MSLVLGSVSSGKRARAGDDAPVRYLTDQGASSVKSVADPIFQDILDELEDLGEGADLYEILRIKINPDPPKWLKGPSSMVRQIVRAPEDPIFQDILDELADPEEGSDLYNIFGIKEQYLKEVDRIYKFFSVFGEWIYKGLALYDYTDAEQAAVAIISDLSGSEEFKEIAGTSSLPLAKAVLDKLFLDGILINGFKKTTYTDPLWQIIFGLISFDIPGQVNPFLYLLSSMGKGPIFNLISQKQGYSDCIGLIFDKIAIYQKVPLSFSEREQAWLTIARGWDENTSKRPPVQFYDTVSRQTSEERQRMYDAAYFHYEYPFLHELVDLPHDIGADAYSINMLWLHGCSQNEEIELLYPEFESEMAVKALEWARLNPGTVVNLWYDEERVSRAVVERSRKKIREMGGEVKVVFRSIRALPNDPMFCSEILSKEEFNALFSIETDLSAPFEAVYPKVDALKVLIANYLGRQGETSLCVDIDCMSLAKEEIFCKRTMSQLRDVGIVMAAAGSGYENGFVITYPRHSEIVEGCKKVFDQALKKLAERKAREGSLEGGDFYNDYYPLLEKNITVPPGFRRKLPTKPVPLPVSQFA